MVEAVFALGGRLNLNVLRTWAFLDCDIAVSGTLPAAPKTVFTFNTGTRTRAVLSLTTARMVLNAWIRRSLSPKLTGYASSCRFTNNWPAFGGVDQYLKWFGLSGHDQFFRNPEAKQAYRKLCRTLDYSGQYQDGLAMQTSHAILELNE
jgi:endo-1,4-beta-mannosidase